VWGVYGDCTVRERPILFSAPMVRALMAGTKTQTRRIVKPQPVKSSGTHRGYPLQLMANDWAWPHPRTSGATTISNRPNGPLGWEIHCPYGLPGDHLWGRETWRYSGWTEDGLPWVEYHADGATRLCERGISEEWSKKLMGIWADLSAPQNFELDGRAADRRWRPAIHMPRWASRLTLEITGVRVERLQDISDEDAIAEGIERASDWHENEMWKGYQQPGTRWFLPRQAYRDLWESINGPESWEANPWVWVVEFRRVES